MSLYDNIDKYEVYAKVAPTTASTFGYGFVHSDHNIYPHIQSDLFFNIFLTKKYDYYEYVDVKRDDKIIPIQRQELNPYFIELSFFDFVDRVGIANGYQLTNSMVQFIRTVRPDLVNKTDSEIREWFDKVGYYELPWNKGQANETTLGMIEDQGILINTIMGRSKIFNIDVNL